MIALVCVCVCAIVAVVVIHARQDHLRSQEWARERELLLERIQRPDVRPASVAPQFVLPDPEPDDMELVGTIRFEEPDA